MDWEYVAGGRIDSPPTYHKGLLLFGSRDGWVHCVRASDGVPVSRHSMFDPRSNGYTLLAKSKSAAGWVSKWSAKIPMTGKAMTLAGDTIFIAGAPLVFDPDDLAATYEGRRGGVLWAASANNGSKIAKYTLDTLPAWDGIAAAYGKLFIVDQEGNVECWGPGS
jgi:hypothetical protein